MSNKVFTNDDIVLLLRTKKDISSYSDIRIKYEKPNGSKGWWTGFVDNSTNITAVVNFDIPGMWKVQAYAANPGEKLHGMWTDVKVYDPIAPDTAPPTTPAPTS